MNTESKFIELCGNNIIKPDEFINLIESTFGWLRKYDVDIEFMSTSGSEFHLCRFSRLNFKIYERQSITLVDMHDHKFYTTVVDINNEDYVDYDLESLIVDSLSEHSEDQLVKMFADWFK